MNSFTLLKRVLDEQCESEIGYDYKDLKLPRVYCWGTKSSKMDAATDFLQKNGLESKAFTGTHWLMLEQREKFYTFVNQFFSS